MRRMLVYRFRYMLILAVVAALAFGTAPALAVTSGTCAVTSTADSGSGTLRAALADPACDPINIVVSGTITLTSGVSSGIALQIMRDVSIRNVSGGTVVVDGNNERTVLYLGSEAPGNIAFPTVTISGITISGGNAGADGCGGGIHRVPGVLTLNDVIISGNTAGRGGGLCNGGIVVLNNATISNNTATNGDGGGVLSADEGPATAPTITMNNSVVSGNVAAQNGGGVYNFDQSAGGAAKIVLNGSSVTSNNANAAAGGGGGIYNFASGDGSQAIVEVISHSLVSGNSATTTNGGGGGIFSSAVNNGSNARVTVTNGTISGNVTARNGGGINSTSVDGGAVKTEITGSTISGNETTASFGGGILSYADGPESTASLTITSSDVSENNADVGGGGGIQGSAGNEGISSTTIASTTIARNSASAGGGLQNDSGSGGTSTMAVTSSTITGNTAIGPGGGGVWNSASLTGSTSSLTLVNSTISGNLATGGNGGGLYNIGGTLSNDFVTVANNESGGGAGGGLYTAGTVGLATTTTVGHSVVANNAALSDVDCASADGGLNTSVGYNVVGSDTGCPSNGTADLAYSGVPNALLSPLASNSGPTQTHALPSGSAALDRAPTDQCGAANGVDQRGRPRPEGPGCDSGAFELTSIIPLTVTTNGHLSVVSNGTVTLVYPYGTVVAVTAGNTVNMTFVGWTVDGIDAGWARTMTITMETAHTVRGNFVPTKFFARDPQVSHSTLVAITELASRGTILGYDETHYGPNDGVQRAQMAALIARAMPNGPGTPTNGTLTPPGCTVAGTWDCEDWGNTFTDRGGVPASLWRDAGTLQHYGVAFGYSAGDCAARGKAFPCYGPTDPVSYAQTVAFIARAMIAKGYWVAQPAAPLPGGNVPGVLATPIRTFAFYTGGIPDAPSDWNAGASRAWFAEALWAALDSYWGTDGNLPDGRPAGGIVP